MLPCTEYIYSPCKFFLPGFVSFLKEPHSFKNNNIILGQGAGTIWQYHHTVREVEAFFKHILYTGLQVSMWLSVSISILGTTS